MTTIDLTVWTCDRCGRKEERETHDRRGDKQGPPTAWRTLQVRGERSRDICGDCADSYYAWVSTPETTR